MSHLERAVIIQATQDKSWRVKLCLGKNFANLAEICGKEISENPLSNIFTTLLKDPEVDVRLASCESLAKFIKFLSPDRLNNMIPYIQALAKDHSVPVRARACEVLAAAIPLAGKEVTSQKLSPYIFELLQDKADDVKIRFEFFKNSKG